MIRYARTYGSKLFPEKTEEAWQFPTGPSADIFGVKVPDANKTFGLEEFNFNNKLRELKLAYVPCYATARTYPRQNNVKELKLIFKTSGRCHLHYATMFDVNPIMNKEIKELRNLIDKWMNEIYFQQKSQEFFGIDFEEFKNIINRMKGSELIAENHNNSPFLVNVRYKKLEILKTPIICELNPRNANQWKIQVDIPGNCSI